MKTYSFLYITVLLFNFLIYNVLAVNEYYVISIRKNAKDAEYDEASEEVQEQIDELVNDRMNDIYNIIADNQNAYSLEDGKVDEKLNEIKENLNSLKKRNDNGKKTKFRFINKNRPQKRSFKREDINELIPIESQLVVHVCPVKNYYVIIAYLSEDLVEKIRKLPNVINCNKYIPLKPSYIIDKRDGETADSNTSANKKYYDEQKILEETGWKGVSVKEKSNNPRLLNLQLSPLSQGVYKDNSTLYDNNYYYPSSGGKGIDIYVIDNGLNVEQSIEDFDTYEGTDNERIVQCDAQISLAQVNPPNSEKECQMTGATTEFNHGTLVSMLAAGSVNGAAKYANIHMLSCSLTSYNILAALDYVKQNATPHKTVVNISIGCGRTDDEDCFDTTVQDKVLELDKMGIIIVVAAGNENRNRCNVIIFEGCKGVIPIGAIENEDVDFDYIEEMYQKASYSNFGECVVGFAPGTLRTPRIYNEKGIKGLSGTSFASPLVAGVVATLMSDDPETEYDFESMKKKLIDLSIKDVIGGLDDVTPNRLINNGKKSIYVPPRCDDPSGKNNCGEDCCSSFGFCTSYEETLESDYCLVEYGCQSEFGFCTTKLCGKNHGNRKCEEDECCSKEGICVKINNDKESKCYTENGCLSEYGYCTTKVCGPNHNNRECLEDECCNGGTCVKIEDDTSHKCYKENGCMEDFGYCTTNVCGPSYNRTCLEGECCNSGSCVKISTDSLDKCFEEKGCIKEYSDVCLTYDTDRLDEFSEEYQKIILKKECIKEVTEFKKKCFFALDIMFYPKNETQQISICDGWANGDCDNFFKTPYEFVPICKRADYKFSFDTEEKKYLSDYNRSIQDLYCSKRNDGEFCLANNDMFYIDNFLVKNLLDKKYFCATTECEKPLLTYLTQALANLKGFGEELVGDQMLLIKELIDYFQGGCIDPVPAEGPDEEPNDQPGNDPGEQSANEPANEPSGNPSGSTVENTAKKADSSDANFRANNPLKGFQFYIAILSITFAYCILNLFVN